MIVERVKKRTFQKAEYKNSNLYHSHRMFNAFASLRKHSVVCNSSKYHSRVCIGFCFFFLFPNASWSNSNATFKSLEIPYQVIQRFVYLSLTLRKSDSNSHGEKKMVILKGIKLHAIRAQRRQDVKAIVIRRLFVVYIKTQNTYDIMIYILVFILDKLCCGGDL